LVGAVNEVDSHADTNTTNIGDLAYTEDNYITDSEPLTESVDKLDMAVKDNADLISTNTQFTDVDNVVYSWRFIKSAEGHMQLEYTEVI
jgi:tetrahydromethanopterin S-methyltransferase subunit B